MSVPVIPFDAGQARLDWLELAAALEAGHALPKAEIGDTVLQRGGDTMLSRAAWIDGMGLAVKTATVFPGNAKVEQPPIHGGVTLYSDRDGTLAAILDFHLVTKWKTAADSLLGALKLARKESERILIVGAGAVGHSLYAAYSVGFPKAKFTVWNRTFAKAHAFAAAYDNVTPVDDLAYAVRAADIITCATMATSPILNGDWLQPGQHVDLIGAFRPDMREADNDAVTRGTVFVDTRNGMEGAGDLAQPIAAGIMTWDEIVADYYDLVQGRHTGRRDGEEITVCKNVGGGHLDLFTAEALMLRMNS